MPQQEHLSAERTVNLQLVPVAGHAAACVPGLSLDEPCRACMAMLRRRAYSLPASLPSFISPASRLPSPLAARQAWRLGGELMGMRPASLQSMDCQCWKVG